ncbi:MAG: hypothetical protein GY827_03285 [Cytophagales bacterium]|nr:hypothetical protein [Cytophagales bacterium]
MKKIFLILCLFFGVQFAWASTNSSLFTVDEEQLKSDFSELTSLENKLQTVSVEQREELMKIAVQQYTGSSEFTSGTSLALATESNTGAFFIGLCCFPVAILDMMEWGDTYFIDDLVGDMDSEEEGYCYMGGITSLAVIALVVWIASESY